MKALFTLLLLGSATACFAQSDYTYVVEATTKLGDESVPAYRTLADTAGKPSTKLFAHSKVDVIGRLGSRWTIVRKGDTEYAIRTNLLPADAQQVAIGALAVKAIPFDPATSKILYTEVIQVPGTSQAELYTRSKLWFASTFKSAKAVVQADEKEAGVVQGSAFQNISITALGMPSHIRLWYTVKMTLKDGRYKYEITDFQVQENPTQYNLNPNLSPAESCIDTNQKKGIMLSVAKSARRELAFAGTQLSAAIISGMSKPAVSSTAAGKDW